MIFRTNVLNLLVFFRLHWLLTLLLLLGLLRGRFGVVLSLRPAPKRRKLNNSCFYDGSTPF